MQFAKITLNDAIKEYQLGFLTATGLVRYWVKTTMRSGWKIRKSPKEIYESLTISKSAFYKAIATLKTLGYIDFEIHGEVTIKNTEADEPIVNSELLSANVDSFPQSWTAFHNRGRESTNVDGESTIVDRRSSKQAQGKGCSPSSDSSQIYIKSSSSINQGNVNPDDDDDDVGSSSVERPKKASRHKLAIKALAPILKECSEDHQEWERFFDWCDEKLWDSFDEPIKNKIGWLKSIDPETELSRLEVNWINYASQPDENTPKKLSAPQAWQKALTLASRLQFGQRTEQVISPHDEAELYQCVMAIGGLGRLSSAEPQELSRLKANFIERYKNIN
jgi:hypothetical protein